jgi:hypothetical protein
MVSADSNEPRNGAGIAAEGESAVGGVMVKKMKSCLDNVRKQLVIQQAGLRL